MSKLFFYDLETTGVDYRQSGIHQISGMILIDGKIRERFNFRVCPHEKSLFEEEALQVCGVTKEQVISYPSMKEVYNSLVQILSKYVDKFDSKDKFHLAGYNISAFDNFFLRTFFIQCEDYYFGSWFWPDCIDCYVLASNKLKEIRPTLPDFKQKTVAKHLGVEIDNERLHDAEYDIYLALQIYLKVKD
mgnify:CR=1 FL=1